LKNSYNDLFRCLNIVLYLWGAIANRINKKRGYFRVELNKKSPILLYQGIEQILKNLKQQI
jgi:hypothetical protein